MSPELVGLHRGSKCLFDARQIFVEANNVHIRIHVVNSTTVVWLQHISRCKIETTLSWRHKSHLFGERKQEEEAVNASLEVKDEKTQVGQVLEVLLERSESAATQERIYTLQLHHLKPLQILKCLATHFSVFSDAIGTPASRKESTKKEGIASETVLVGREKWAYLSRAVQVDLLVFLFQVLHEIADQVRHPILKEKNIPLHYV